MALLLIDETSWQVLPKDDTVHIGSKNQMKDKIKCMHVYGSLTERRNILADAIR